MTNLNADLHAHTDYSADCEDFSPTDLVRKAKEVGLKYVAITDHDEVGGVEEALKAGKEFGVEVVPGVEMHSNLGEVLGLFIDHKNKEFVAACRRNKELSNAGACDTIERLRKDGFEVDVSEIKKIYKREFVHSSHIARELVRKGYAESVREAYSKFLKKGSKYRVDVKFPSAVEAIKAIKKAGGVAVLAHPFLENYEKEFSMMKELVDAGLDGIELFSGSFRPDYFQTVADESKRLADKYGLVLTSGSDSHGHSHPTNILGKFNCDEEVVAALKKRLRKK